MGTSFKSEEKTLKNINILTDEQLAAIQYFWHDSDGAHVSTIPQTIYDAHQPGTTCIEVLITSSAITFRRGYRGLSGNWSWTVYATYASTGITLGSYASMTTSGIVLGDTADVNNQLLLDPATGVKLNGKIVIVSDYATGALAEQTSTHRIATGIVGSDSKTITFSVPTECLIPEGLSINMSMFLGNIALTDGSYYVDGSYATGGSNRWNFSPYTLSAVAAGSAITVTITKSSTFKKGSTTTVVPANSTVTVDIHRVGWSKPAV